MVIRLRVLAEGDLRAADGRARTAAGVRRGGARLTGRRRVITR